MVKYVYLFLILILIVPSSSYASTIEEELAREQDRILRQEQKELENLEKGYDHKLPQEGYKLPLKEKIVTEDKGICVNISDVEIIGSTILSAKHIDAYKRELIDKCAYLSDIENLAADITNYYVSEGYVTSRAFIEEQDTSSGKVVILVLEGKVESIELNDNSLHDQMQVKMALPGKVGKLLNVRELEQGLDQMNRLSSNNVTMDLLPGSAELSTKVILKNTQKNKTKGSLSYDNEGTSNSGKRRAKGTIYQDNLFSLNDNLYLSVIHDLGNHAQSRYNKSITFGLSVPYGDYTLSGSLQHGNSRSTSSTGVSLITSDNVNDTQQISINKLLNRGEAYKINYGVSLAVKDVEGYIAGYKSNVQSRKLTVIANELQYTYLLPNMPIYSSLKWNRGVNWFGATKDVSYASKSMPKAQFDNLQISANLVCFLNDKFKYNGSVFGQHSFDSLYGSEAIALGDLNTIRGYRDESLAGDSGYYIRNEISYKLESPDPFIENPEIYTGFDFGMARKFTGKEANNGEGYGYMSGFGVGGRFNVGKVSFSLDYTKAIKSPVFIDKTGHEIYFSISVGI